LPFQSARAAMAEREGARATLNADGSARHTARLEVLAVGTEEELFRPCVDCWRRTGNFCDFCFVAERMPDLDWVENQATPFCTVCDKKFGRCVFCRAELVANDTRATDTSNLPECGSSHAQADRTSNTAATSSTEGRPRQTGEPPNDVRLPVFRKHREDPLRRWQLINALNLTPAACSTAPAPQTPEGDTPAASSTAPAPVRLIEEPLSERLKAIMNRGVRENLSAGS